MTSKPKFQKNFWPCHQETNYPWSPSPSWYTCWL